jgi:hypothetical protein
MRGLAHGRVVHVQIVANGPHYHLARVQAHPDLDFDPVRAADLGTVAPERVLHGQGGVTGPDGVVFMGDGSAEQGHDAIPQHLIDRALIAMHGVHHALQHRIEQLPGFLGVAVGQQFHGALQVGKQHGDLLALAFEDSTGSEDLFGQVWWRVGQRGLGLHRRRSGSGGCGRHRVARPDQDIASLIDRQALALDEFVLQIFQGRVVELELSLEGAVGQASATLEHGHRVVENLLKGHRQPSVCL